MLDIKEYINKSTGEKLEVVRANKENRIEIMEWLNGKPIIKCGKQRWVRWNSHIIKKKNGEFFSMSNNLFSQMYRKVNR